MRYENTIEPATNISSVTRLNTGDHSLNLSSTLCAISVKASSIFCVPSEDTMSMLMFLSCCLILFHLLVLVSIILE